MFITVCGWIFCVIIFIILVFLAINIVQENANLEYIIHCDPEKNDGVCSRIARGTWYGWSLKTTTGQKKIVPKILFQTCVFFVLPIVWICIIIIFAV